MRVTAQHHDRLWEVELGNGVDLSIALEFDGPQPNAFGLPPADSQPFEAGGFVGDTRRGGSVNCETVTVTPHGNGTHTECVGHIVDERISVADILQDTLIVALVTSVRPVELGDSQEEYDAPGDPHDRVVSAESLRDALHAFTEFDADALVVRTLPNPLEKREREWSGNNPVYFTSDAIRAIRQHNVKHLLVDFPSVDREEDEGLLPNHHIFWDVPQGTHELLNVPSPATITEMIYVPEVVADGAAFLTIGLPDWVLDAAPSRPRIFPARAI